MKRFLLFGVVLAILAGYALIAAGSTDVMELDSDKASANTEGQQKDDETTKTMPNVIGMTAEEAQSTLKSANIQITKWVYNQSVIKDKVPSDHTINSLGNRSNGAPSDKKVWTVIGQNIAQGERVDDGVILTVDLKVINSENNLKFHTIMNEDNSGANAFVKEHKGELVEFVGTVVAWEGTYIVDIAIVGWDDKQEYVSEFFYLDNCHNMTLYMQDLNTFKPGATYHIVGRIEGYDETENKGIILTLVGLDYLSK